jgi:hypothetical protein
MKIDVLNSLGQRSGNDNSVCALLNTEHTHPQRELSGQTGLGISVG